MPVSRDRGGTGTYQEKGVLGENPAKIARMYGEANAAADALHAQAAQILELAKRLEELTKDTPACMPAREPEWR